MMALCAVLVTAILAHEKPDLRVSLAGAEDEGVGGAEALRLLKNSRHLQTIALIIGFAAVGAAIIEQQLNMAAAASKGAGNTDSITSFLGTVQLYTSVIGFVIQVWLTSKIQRYLGIGFALMILPFSLGITGTMMLLNGVLWAPALARVIDTSLRYTVDKTTREILFLPLPDDLKQRAKPFIDVTVDRFSKGIGALIVLVLINKTWGFHFGWQQLSWASLRDRPASGSSRRCGRGASTAPSSASRWTSRRSQPEPAPERRRPVDHGNAGRGAGPPEPAPRHLRDRHAGVAGQASPDHAAAAQSRFPRRPRASAGDGGTRHRPSCNQRWLPGVERLLRIRHRAVRASAVRALAATRGEQAVPMMRPHLTDRDPAHGRHGSHGARASSQADDVRRRSARWSASRYDAAAVAMRRAAARSRRRSARLTNPEFRRLLVPLMYDPNRDVALEAIRSAGRLGGEDYLFVPPLVSLLRNRLLKAAARNVLVGYGTASPRRSPISCATRTKTSGCAGTSRRRWPAFPASRRWTCWWMR